MLVAVGFMALVAIAALEPRVASPYGATANGVPPASSPAATPRLTPGALGRPGPHGRILAAARMIPVRLVAPSHGDQVITTLGVLIDGRLQIKAATVEFALEGDAARRLDSRTFDTSNRDGGIRPVRAPTFHFELALPTPRPEGRLWVVVTAFDAAGVELGSLRRPVIIGAIPG